MNIGFLYPTEDLVYMNISLKKLFITLFIVIVPSLGFAQNEIYRNEVTTNTDGNIETIKTYGLNNALVQSLTFTYTKAGSLGPLTNLLTSKKDRQQLAFEVKVESYSNDGTVINTATQKGTYDPENTKTRTNTKDMSFSGVNLYEMDNKEVSSVKALSDNTQAKMVISSNSNHDFIIKETTSKTVDDKETKTKDVTYTYEAYLNSNKEPAVTLGLEKNIYDAAGKIQGTLSIDTEGSYTITKYARTDETLVSSVETYYPNGTPKYEGKFINGKPEGKHTTYFDNGLKSVEENYLDGTLDGTRNVFYKEPDRVCGRDKNKEDRLQYQRGHHKREHVQQAGARFRRSNTCR